ncbi:hypothetical protein [Streptomyces sp. NPDC093094]
MLQLPGAEEKGAEAFMQTSVGRLRELGDRGIDGVNDLEGDRGDSGDRQ